MLKEVINRARGQARIRVTCPYPEPGSYTQLTPATSGPG